MPEIAATNRQLHHLLGHDPGHTMRDALEGWKRESEATPSTAQEWGRVIDRFGPDRRVESVTDTDVQDFVDAERARGLSKGTVAKYLTALKTVLGYASRGPRRWIATNPAAGIKLRGGKTKEKRLPFTAADLRLIFGGPVHAKRETPTMATAGGAAAFWLPILALYTGARQNELAQLDAADVGREGGVAYIAIGDEGEGQRVKTASSRRRVPLHPDSRDEFLAFVPAKGLLFPDLRPSTFGDRSKAWSQWWSRYMRKLGVTDQRKVFHSFRHLFKDLCREAEIPKEVHDRLTGHGVPDEGGSYGEGPSLRLMAKHVRRIKVPVKVFGAA
jgi:integrase